ncbi:MAG: hypothetical protein JNM81_17510 [Rhodospirillaceae bacterium]|nr:hypothetical protein [Rhodospirillaceae bacterium]
MFVVIAAVVLSAAGLSQVYRSAFWSAYYEALLGHGPTAIRGHGAIIGLVGCVVVLVHNVWDGPALVLTLFGWLLLAEGGFCVLAPQVSLRSMGAASPEVRRKAIIATGAGVLVVAGVLWASILGL